MVRVIRSAWRATAAAGRLLTVGALLATLGVTAAWVPVSVAALATGVSVGVLVAAALVDAVEHRLPNAVVAVAALPVVVALAIDVDLLWSALLGAAVVGGPLLVTHLVAPSGMGFGDVKAGAVLGAALGLLAAPLALLALVLGLLAAATFGLVRRRGAVALGPSLVAGAVLALALGRLVGVDVVAP